MVLGRTVRLFLVDGSPTGIVTAEIMNWTGHILAAPRSRIAEALKRPEASRTGVYFLVGDDPDYAGRSKIYIGEGDSVVDRIKAHAKDQTKDFWSHVCLVTSKDANLTKAHVRYLENRMLDVAKAAGRASIANGNEPGVKQLPESDIADMEYFISQIEVALPVLGHDFLRMRPTSLNLQTAEQPDEADGSIDLVLVSKKHGISARAIERDGEITILKGSSAVAKDDYTSNTYASRRKALIDAGDLTEDQSGLQLIFTRDIAFRSPSEAAAVVLNRNSNGRTEWRLSRSGATLKEWQDAQLDEVESPN